MDRANGVRRIGIGNTERRHHRNLDRLGHDLAMAVVANDRVFRINHQFIAAYAAV